MKKQFRFVIDIAPIVLLGLLFFSLSACRWNYETPPPLSVSSDHPSGVYDFPFEIRVIKNGHLEGVRSVIFCYEMQFEDSFLPESGSNLSPVSFSLSIEKPMTLTLWLEEWDGSQRVPLTPKTLYRYSAKPTPP